MSLSLPFPAPSNHTKRYLDLSQDDIHASELIVLSKDATERRGQLPLWDEIRKSEPERLVSIIQKDSEHIIVEKNGEPNLEISLRDEDALNKLIASEKLLIDISGLPHNIWAPLLKSAHNSEIPTRVLYAEPESYKTHPTPASATLFDLSISFDGLAPLPGFVQLSGPDDETKCLFIALLGFEGSRPERLVLQIDPTPKVIPIIGVPGFQLEFPAFTIACNRVLFSEYRAHADLRLARASCPFEVYEILKEIRKDFPEHYMYLAPVGTKPHSLGAIWYAIKNPDNTEIMFDYPVRKTGRTKGIGVIHIYDFGEFDAD